MRRLIPPLAPRPPQEAMGLSASPRAVLPAGLSVSKPIACCGGVYRRGVVRELISSANSSPKRKGCRPGLEECGSHFKPQHAEGRAPFRFLTLRRWRGDMTPHLLGFFVRLPTGLWSTNTDLIQVTDQSHWRTRSARPLAYFKRYAMLTVPALRFGKELVDENVLVSVQCHSHLVASA